MKLEDRMAKTKTKQIPNVAPDGRIIYKCSTCGAEGVKLWRGYNTMVSHQQFFCVRCVCKEDQCVTRLTDHTLVNADGRHKGEFGWTDQINGFVPCVTSADGEEIWGYTSVPQDRVEWWRALPNVVSGDSGE